MKDNSQGGSRPLKEIFVFLGLTFGITWSIAAVVIAFPVWFLEHFGELNPHAPAFYVAVWAPNIAAIVTTAIFTMRAGGFSKLFRAVLRWRAPVVVWMVAIFAYPVMVLLFQIVQSALGGKPMSPVATWLTVPSIMLAGFQLSLGPLGEELGWRGVLLPRLLERLTTLVSGVVLGAIWMLWHLPQFLIATAGQGDHSYLPFFLLGALSISVLSTWLYRKSAGSILVAGIVPHVIINCIGIAELVDYGWGMAAFFLPVTAIIVYLDRRTFFTHANEIPEV
jgi:membrane protease YdiL (CAAX protease family)